MGKLMAVCLAAPLLLLVLAAHASAMDKADRAMHAVRGIQTNLQQEEPGLPGGMRMPRPKSVPRRRPHHFDLAAAESRFESDRPSAVNERSPELDDASAADAAGDSKEEEDKGDAGDGARPAFKERRAAGSRSKAHRLAAARVFGQEAGAVNVVEARAHRSVKAALGGGPVVECAAHECDEDEDCDRFCAKRHMKTYHCMKGKKINKPNCCCKSD